MHKKLIALVCLVFAFSAALKAENQPSVEAPEFVILVTSYNNERYCEQNLASIAWQKSSKPYRIIIVNDCSTDRTGELLESFIQTHSLESRVTLIHNEQRCYSLKNIYTTIHNNIEDHEIVVSVDGDDMLASDKVLLRLEQEYAKPYIHLTYGSSFPMGAPKKRKKKARRKGKIADEIIRTGTIRRSKGYFKASHLKTFRAGLFKHIKKEDLMYEGEFFQAAGDVAFMYAMIDMLASTKPEEPIHVAFIPEIIYLYNTGNPINVYKSNRARQHLLGTRIGSLPSYKPINTELLPRSRQTKKQS